MSEHSPDNNKKCRVMNMKKWFLFLFVLPVFLILSYAAFKPNVRSLVSNAVEAYSVQKLIKFPHEKVKTGNLRGAKMTMTSSDDVTTLSFEEGISNSNSTTIFFPKPEAANKTDLDLRPHNSTQNGATAVMLLTYMRSGSSLTGDILQQPEDAFYVFEPLRNAHHNHRDEKSIHFLNGTYLAYGKYDLQHIYKETMYGWLTCDLLRVYGQSLLDFGFLAFGHKFKKYKNCVRNIRLLALLEENRLHENKAFMRCLNMLQQTCMNSNYRIVKTIRLKMDIAKDLLNKIPNSKILNLIRDPRATIESKRHREVCPEGITMCIAEHCANVRKDTVVRQNLTLEAPDRVSHVLYEDIASRPLNTSKTMYSFIGMNFTDTIAQYVHNITLGKDKSGCRVCTTLWQVGKSRASSDTHIDAWKKALPGEYINQTEVICHDIIDFYGYEHYMAPPNGKTIIKKRKIRKRTVN